GHLPLRQHLGDHALDSDLLRDAARRTLVVAGEEHRLEPELFQLPHGLAAGRLDGVAHDETCTRFAVPRHGDRPAAAGHLDALSFDDTLYADAGNVSETGHRR